MFNDDFMLLALLGGLGLALASGPFGCYLIWRRNVFAVETAGHSWIFLVALFGVTYLPLWVALIALVAFGVFAYLVYTYDGFNQDTCWIIILYSSLGLGLFILSLASPNQVNIQALLFGDILSLNWQAVGAIWLASALVIGIIVWRWQRILAVAISAEWAKSCGIDQRHEDGILLLPVIVLVFIALKLVGALPLGALLILPAAAARVLMNTPAYMGLCAAILAAICVLGGLALAYYADAPAGPAIASLAFFVLAVTLVYDKAIDHFHAR